jgi:hypothetical protein
MELTKEFVRHCRKINILQDFLCQAIDQIDGVDKTIAELKYRAISMFRERRNCIGLDTHSPIGQIANAAYKHWNMVEQIRIENVTLKHDKSDLMDIAQTLRFELNDSKRIHNKIVAREKHKRCLKMAELCCERKENCYNIALRKYTKSEADSLVKKSEFWEEWEDTWIQLAHRFNEK